MSLDLRDEIATVGLVSLAIIVVIRGDGLAQTVLPAVVLALVAIAQRAKSRDVSK